MVACATRREAFMRSVIDAPEDDAPRLIMADWLEENGEAEFGEFIRVQCALARPVACELDSGLVTYGITCEQHDARTKPYRVMVRCGPCKRRDALRDRERALLSARGEEWEAPARAVLGPRRWANVPGLAAGGECVDYGFLRGFIDRVELAGAAWWGERECQLCAGGGLEAQETPCRPCRGSGRVNALGPALVRAAPICEVLPNSIPRRLLREDRLGRWIFYAPLPSLLTSLSPGFYHSAEEAAKAAGAAALRWARSAAVAGKGRENVRSVL